MSPENYTIEILIGCILITLIILYTVGSLLYKDKRITRYFIIYKLPDGGWLRTLTSDQHLCLFETERHAHNMAKLHKFEVYEVHTTHIL